MYKYTVLIIEHLLKIFTRFLYKNQIKSNLIEIMYQISDGWFAQARQIHSPNYNARPENTEIDSIIIHSISLPPGQYGGNEIDRFFTNQLDWKEHEYFKEIQGLQVSAHLLIRRDGELVQYVSFNDRAWHAGQSCLKGRENCNDFSIGIELEGTDNSLFETPQYEILSEVIKSLIVYYPQITRPNIAGHSDIAPGRKTDPGSGFDWAWLKQKL